MLKAGMMMEIILLTEIPVVHLTDQTVREAKLMLAMMVENLSIKTMKYSPDQDTVLITVT